MSAVAARLFAWERSYPPGVRWDAPVETGTIPGLLDRAAARFGDLTAIEYFDKHISYRELAALTLRAAAGLSRLGVGRDTPVALYLPNTPVHPITFFGALRLGARIVHLSPLDAERELAHKLHDSGARLLVTTNLPGLLPRALKLAADGHVDRIIVGDEKAWNFPAPVEAFMESDVHIPFRRLLEAGEAIELPALGPDDIALLQYTGGTTGVPKGAILTHGNITAAVSIYDRWQTPQRTPTPRERVICVLPLFHIYGLSAVFLRGLDTGAEILLRPRFDVESILRDIEVRRAQYFPGVPTMWIALMSLPDIEKRDISSLKVCSSGGAPMPVEVAQRFERLTGRTMLGGWGMTETSPAGTGLPLQGPAKPGSIGLVVPGVEMGIVALDNPRRPLPPGEIGEMRIKGPNVFKGYWNRPEETAAAFADGFFLTGDIGYMDEDGYFFLVDRKKDMIISGGFNVYPSVIESATYEHPDVEEVIVIGIPDTYRGEAAKAFVKLRRGAKTLDLEGLNAFLSDKIGRHEMPTALEIRDSLPRTPVGKLSKKELIEEERKKRNETPAPAPESRKRARS
ncbi:MAG TPA: dicarboxylate--CoA ligase PimA [Xanthobacteraceae bacterium]|nr:dicarboxylate--CoA ligase PimA [Xanthobacteraceae bacterium]